MFRRLSFVAIFLSLTATFARADDWPQWRGPNRDGVWNETGVVEKFAAKELTPKWRVPLGPGYCGPTIAAGHVYVMDRQTDPKQTERVHCFRSADGKPLWTHEYDCSYRGVGYAAGPRASVTIDEGRAYALGSMGHLHCLDAKTGEVLWAKDCNTVYQIEMPIWGITAAPLIYKDLVIVHIGGKGACVIAFDKATGDEKWKALDDRGQYSAPVLVKQGDTDVVIVWTGDSVAGLDAASGKVHWRHAWRPKNMPIGVASPVVAKHRVFLTSFYDGSTLLKLSDDKPAADVVWQRVGESERKTDALQSIISTPIIQGDYVYGVDSYGELRCLDLAQGDRVWEDLTAVPKARWSTIHFVKHGEHTWMFNERGELIIAKLSPQGFEEISRTKILSPTTAQLNQRGGVCWTHPGFAERCVFARNDEEMVCVSVAEATDRQPAK
jgi:outer membrane protein assembly factor BamB